MPWICCSATLWWGGQNETQSLRLRRDFSCQNLTFKTFVSPLEVCLSAESCGVFHHLGLSRLFSSSASSTRTDGMGSPPLSQTLKMNKTLVGGKRKVQTRCQKQCCVSFLTHPPTRKRVISVPRTHRNDYIYFTLHVLNIKQENDAKKKKRSENE